jgi:endonuclease/exonuclease/phosphatase family metal-dependent hydrolase
LLRDVAGAGTSPRRGEAGEQLRVLNWNVRELIGNDGIVRTDDDGLDAIVEVVAREHPDVLVLQEVSQGSVLSEMSDNLDELVRRTGATDAVLVPNGMRASGKAKGQAVLTFGDARIQDARGLRHEDPLGDGVGRRVLAGASPLRMIGVRLPDSLPDTYMPRTSADVLVTTAGGTDVRVLNEHLSGTSSGIGGSPNSTRSQEDQLGPVADSVAAWAGPTLLLGDFNVTSGTQFHEFERRLLEGVGLHDTFDEAGVAATDLELRTFPAVRPDHNIDRAYASREFTATSVRALQDEVARRGSDHVPVLVEARIR